jgi:hypothetical protein
MLLTFLADLLRDPKLQKKFSENPDELLKQLGLSDAQRKAVLTRDFKALGDLLAQEIPRLAPPVMFWAAPGIGLSSISPDSGKQGQTLQVTLQGSWFDPNVTGQIETSGTEAIPLTNTQVNGANTETSTLTGTLALTATTPTGQWTVRVTNPSGDSATLPLGFQVTSGSQAR